MEEICERFRRNSGKEEILQKKTQIKEHRKEVIDIYEEIKKKSSTLRYICILRVMNRLNKDLYQRVMTIHTRKISRMLSKAINVDEHIKNYISSLELIRKDKEKFRSARKIPPSGKPA